MPSRPGISMSSSATSGALVARRGEHLVAALDLADDLDVVLEREQARERSADHRLVLGDQDADHGSASGTVTRSRKPPLGPGAGLERAAHALRALAQAVEPAAAVARRRGRRGRRRRSRARRSRRSARMRISQWRAWLWRMTFVVPSRTAQASTASTSAGSARLRARRARSRCRPRRAPSARA